MLEQEVEKKIVNAIEALGLDGLDVSGSWQPAASGSVKGTEDAESKAVVYVKVSPRAFDRFGFSEITLDVAVSLAVRADLCPEGTELDTFYGAIAGMFQGWNLDTELGANTALSVSGVFDCGGVNFTGGSGPDLDDGVWTVVMNLTLRGTVPQSSN